MCPVFQISPQFTGQLVVRSPSGHFVPLQMMPVQQPQTKKVHNISRMYMALQVGLKFALFIYVSYLWHKEVNSSQQLPSNDITTLRDICTRIVLLQTCIYIYFHVYCVIYTISQLLLGRLCQWRGMLKRSIIIIAQVAELILSGQPHQHVLPQ